ncbi:MAG: queuosine precursor transporter [Planctomycetota bacterium]
MTQDTPSESSGSEPASPSSSVPDSVQLPPIDGATYARRRELVFLLMAGIFLGTLAVLNVLGVSRFLAIGSYTDDGGFQWGNVLDPGADGLMFAVAVGVLPYPITFLCTDLISEFYGRKRASMVVWIGLILNLWVMGVLWLGGVLPGFGPIQQSFFDIRTAAFGAVTASMIAYLAAQMLDVHLFHFWKRVTKGKALWLRNNASTICSQLIDTVAVILITHFAVKLLPVSPNRDLWTQLWLFVATGFAFKVVVALIDTPLIYLIAGTLKSYLGYDPTIEGVESEREALYGPK